MAMTNKVAYLFSVPLIVAILAIGYLPIAHSFYLSLTTFSSLNPDPKFVGLENYQKLATDQYFLNAIRVTTIFVVGNLVLEFVVGLFLALLMFGEFRGKRVFGNILFAPLAISPIVMGVLYSPNVVLDDLNTLLYYGLSLGIFIDVNLPFVYYTMMILADAFVWAPLMMLVILAIMSNIPKEHFEAAEVHGASSFQIFRKVTFPAITRSPVLAAIISLRLVDNLRTYEIPFTWSFWLGQDRLGSPIDTFGVLMFKLLSSPDFPLSQISTIALILVVVSVAVTVFMLRFVTKSWEE